MKNLTIDINADVGEGIGNEIELMPYLSSCNIACGGHAGDYSTMQQVVKLAKKHQVKIGAHPSFPDRKNFGRLDLEITSADLYTSLKKQIRNLLNVLREEQASLHHIKPHGALYNLAAKHEKTARVIIEVIKSIAIPLKLYAPYKSVIAQLALSENIDVKFEGFADRNYNDDLSLVSRKKSNALILNSNDVFKHVYQMISEKKLMTINRVEVTIKVDTICMHSDTPNSVFLAQHLYENLVANNVIIQ